MNEYFPGILNSYCAFLENETFIFLRETYKCSSFSQLCHQPTITHHPQPIIARRHSPQLLPPAADAIKCNANEMVVINREANVEPS